MAHYEKTKSVHNKWHAVNAFLTEKKHFIHVHQQINPVYQDEWEDMNPIQFGKYMSVIQASHMPA
jgi:hypothetical protein